MDVVHTASITKISYGTDTNVYERIHKLSKRVCYGQNYHDNRLKIIMPRA